MQALGLKKGPMLGGVAASQQVVASAMTPPSLPRARRGAASADSLFGLDDELAPLSEGDYIRALFNHEEAGLKRRCSGTITKAHADGTYDISYNGEQKECKKPRKFIEKANQK